MKKSAAELAERGGELAQRTLSLIKRMHRTYMLKRYELQFGMRLVVFLVVLFFYLTRKQDFYGLVMRPFWRGISPIHLLWAYFMIIMISHLIPREKLSMAVMKAYTESRRQSPTTEHDELELLRFVKTQNIRAFSAFWTKRTCSCSRRSIFCRITSVSSSSARSRPSS